MIYDLMVGLVANGANGDVVPGMAEAWTVGADRLSYTFTLRDGLQWSDSTPLTAKDFVYSLRRAIAPETASPNASLLYAIKNARAINSGKQDASSLGVTAHDDHTLEIFLDEPVPYFLETLLAASALPVPRHLVETREHKWARPGVMVSNGPYILAEWVTQAHIKIEKNNLFYNANAVQIDNVYYYHTYDVSTALKRFRAGELDMIYDFPLSKIGWMQENLSDELHLYPMLGVYYYIFNTKAPPFDDHRVRKALSMAVDRHVIVTRILKLGNQPAYGIVAPTTANSAGAYLPLYAETAYEQRLEDAKQLLKDAGYDEVNPLRFELRYNTIEENTRIAVALAGMWRAIGVKTELLNSDLITVGNDLNAGNFQMARYAWFAPYNDPLGFLEILESAKAFINFGGYENAAFDTMLSQANSIEDMQERAVLLSEAEAAAMADHPLLPLYFYIGKRLVSTDIKGWIDNERGTNRVRYLRIERE
jgi:oligopeptide transport system substrate-binding protein